MSLEKDIFRDLDWRKENADLGLLTGRHGKLMKRAHTALGKVDISDFCKDLGLYAARSFYEVSADDLSRLGEAAEGIDSVLKAYLGVEAKIGTGFLPEGAKKVKKVKECLSAYDALLAAVLAESYDAFVDDAVLFEKSLKKNNLVDIEKSRAQLQGTLSVYQAVSAQTKARGVHEKRRIEKKMQKYISNFESIDRLNSEIMDILGRFSATEWGGNNERHLRKMQNRFFRGWFFRKGIIAKCSKQRYPEGVLLAEAISSDIDYVLANLQDVSEIRKKIKQDTADINCSAQEIAETGASPAGIERIKGLAVAADPFEYQSIQDNLYFSGLVDAYSAKCEALTDFAASRLKDINSVCVERFHEFEKSGAEDMELEHIQRSFDNLGNKEYSARVTLFRRKQNQTPDFFSMINYISQQECPPKYLMLQETLLGNNGERDWSDRLAAFGCMMDDVGCSSDEERAWLKHARYAIHEDSVRGYLHQKRAGSAHVKKVVDFALAAVDIKLSA